MSCSKATCTKSTSLLDLQKKLREAFEVDDVDFDCVNALLKGYKSNKADWEKYVTIDLHHYTRNLVDAGNDAYNLIVLCWGEGQGSAIHNHSSSDCFVKILSGNLTETRFEPPTTNEPPIKTKVQVYSTDDVSCINDKIGVHRMENKSHTEPCISLHLYYPPLVTCSTYDEQTGHEDTSTMTFHTKFGKKADDALKPGTCGKSQCCRN